MAVLSKRAELCQTPGYQLLLFLLVNIRQDIGRFHIPKHNLLLGTPELEVLHPFKTRYHSLSRSCKVA